MNKIITILFACTFVFTSMGAVAQNQSGIENTMSVKERIQGTLKQDMPTDRPTTTGTVPSPSEPKTKEKVSAEVAGSAPSTKKSNTSQEDSITCQDRIDRYTKIVQRYEEKALNEENNQWKLDYFKSRLYWWKAFCAEK